MNAPRTGPSDRLYGNRIVLSTVRANACAPVRRRADRTYGVAVPVQTRLQSRVCPTRSSWSHARSFRHGGSMASRLTAHLLRRVARSRSSTATSGPRSSSSARRSAPIRSADARVSTATSAPRCAPAAGARCCMPWPNRIANGALRFGGVDRSSSRWNEPQKHNAIHGLVRCVELDRRRGVGRPGDTCSYTLLPQPGYEFPDRAPPRVRARHRRPRRCASRRPTSAPNPARSARVSIPTCGSILITSTSWSCEHPHRPTTWRTTDQIPTGREPVDGTELDFRAAAPDRRNADGHRLHRPRARRRRARDHDPARPARPATRSRCGATRTSAT